MAVVVAGAAGAFLFQKPRLKFLPQPPLLDALVLSAEADWLLAAAG